MKKVVTREGLISMKEELNKLRIVDLKEAIDNMADAREKGDSENSEFDLAKEIYDNLNKKIIKLETDIINSIIINSENVDTSMVQILTKVKVRNLSSMRDIEYSIVPENEVNVKSGKISFNSPIAKSLMGKKKGQVVDVNIPVGKISLEILDINLI